MLTLDHITLRLGAFAIQSDHITIDQGICGVLGPSGAGKSTLLSLIAGFTRPDGGKILWNDKDITVLPPDKRPVGMVFQDNNLFPHLSVYRNLALALTHSTLLSQEQNRLIDKTLERVGLSGLHKRKPGELSGGQQSRAALARVLLQNRPIMALDEPFAALGPALKNEMLDLVADLATERGTLVLMVTHDPNDSLRIAPKTILVAENKIHLPVDTASLLENPPKALGQYLGTRSYGQTPK